MQKSVKSKAEEKFTASQKKAENDRSDREKAQQERLARSAKLRALRLAKEEADKKAAAST